MPKKSMCESVIQINDEVNDKVTYYNSTDTCDRIRDRNRCGRDFHGKAFKEKNADRVWTGNWICRRCYELLKTYGTTEEDTLCKIRRCNILYSKKTCYNCGNDAKLSERDIDGVGTGRFVCTNCYYSVYNKRLTKIRSGIIDLADDNIKGLLTEIAVANVRGLDVMSLTENNFNLKFDLSVDKEFGIIDVKSRIPSHGEWKVGPLRSINFDNAFIACMNRNRKNIEMMYIVPKKEFLLRGSICIVKSQNNLPWYEKYKTDEILYNDEYSKIDLENLSIKLKELAKIL